MNATDVLWQRLLDQACASWSARSADELQALPQLTEHKVRSGNDEIEYALWHVNPEEDWCFDEQHSFVLHTNRRLFLSVVRNYLAGFSLGENGAVIPIADEILERYD